MNWKLPLLLKKFFRLGKLELNDCPVGLDIPTLQARNRKRATLKKTQRNTDTGFIRLDPVFLFNIFPILPSPPIFFYFNFSITPNGY